MGIGETLIVAFLLVLSALFSGLTLGLMGVRADEVQRKARLGDAAAQRVWTVRKEGNRLLTSLLVGNVAVNAVLSVYLGGMLTGVVAAVAATGLIVIFGEIVPQAAFYRGGLALSAHFVPLVRVLMWLAAPIAIPIAALLDRVLGRELPAIYSKEELITLIADHEDHEASEVDADEERIVTGALTFSNRQAQEVMTPWGAVVTCEATELINDALLARLHASGFSRFPVLAGEAVVGVLHIADLLNPVVWGKAVGEAVRLPPRWVEAQAPLDEVLRDLLASREHFRVVGDGHGTPLGVVTLEDIVEEILREEIHDERDQPRRGGLTSVPVRATLAPPAPRGQ